MLSILVCLLGVAVYTDLKSRRIPNSLIVAGVGVALLSQAAPHSGFIALGPEGGAQGFGGLLGGIGTATAILAPLYLLRAMGAGDVKLMMMVGAFLGPTQTVGAVVLTFAAGGVLAIAFALWQRSCHQLATNLRFILTTSAARIAGGQSPRLDPLATTAGRLPYALAIAAGTILQLILIRNGGWALS